MAPAGKAPASRSATAKVAYGLRPDIEVAAYAEACLWRQIWTAPVAGITPTNCARINMPTRDFSTIATRWAGLRRATAKGQSGPDRTRPVPFVGRLVALRPELAGLPALRRSTLRTRRECGVASAAPAVGESEG